MRTLSKSRLLAYRQCPKRLWLEIHHPEYRTDSAATRASFATGHQVGDIARLLYDPQGKGVLLDPKAEGLDQLLQLSQQLLWASPPRALFEAGFRAEGALALADVMLPLRRGGQRAWRMVEVKSSTSIKDYHRDDAAMHAFVLWSSFTGQPAP
jgi:predicted RecB family nuclease